MIFGYVDEQANPIQEAHQQSPKVAKSLPSVNKNGHTH